MPGPRTGWSPHGAHRATNSARAQGHGESCADYGGGTCLVDPKTGAITGLGVGWGAMLSAIITFLLTALVVYLVFVVPMNKYRERTAVEEAAEPDPEEVVLLREIRDSLKANNA